MSSAWNSLIVYHLKTHKKCSHDVRYCTTFNRKLILEFSPT
jgi:hypothetical protein